MNPSWTKHLIVVLYALAGLLLIWSIFTFLYQYIAALGSLREVLSAFGEHRILTALWLSLLSAFVTAALSIVLGIPLAYVLAMKDFPGEARRRDPCGGRAPDLPTGRRGHDLSPHAGAELSIS